MIKGLFLASGYLPLIVLYGVGNFDGGKDNRKLLGYSLLNILWLIVLCCSFLSANMGELICAIVLVASYPLVLTLCGIYNRKHKKTSYTILGKLTDAKQLPQEAKDDYLENKASKSIIAFCEEHKGNNKEVYFHILKAFQEGKLNQTKAEVIWEKYKTE
jgi:hypothetical protein